MTETESAESDVTGLALTPPVAVEVVTDEQALGTVALSLDDRQRLRGRAAAFVAEIMALEPRSPAFAHQVGSLRSMGEQDMRSAAALSGRVIIRPAAGGPGGGGPEGGDAQSRVAATLARLRELVRYLEPSRVHLSGVRKALARFTGADGLGEYFGRYRSSQTELDQVIMALAAGQDDLRRDNAEIDTEKATIWVTLTRLSEYHEMASALDDGFAAAIADLESVGRPEDAAIVRSEAVTAIRDRRQDVATQLAVTLHGFLALDLVRRTNLDLIRGVDRAQRTTIVALRTAVSVSRALEQQELVLERISGLDDATAALVGSHIGRPGSAAGSAGSTADVAGLQQAFDEVFASLDALSTFQAETRASLATTQGALESRGPRPPRGADVEGRTA